MLDEGEASVVHREQSRIRSKSLLVDKINADSPTVDLSTEFDQVFCLKLERHRFEADRVSGISERSSLVLHQVRS